VHYLVDSAAREFRATLRMPSMKNGLMVLAMIAALAACQKKTEEAPPADAGSSAPTATQAPAQPPVQQAEPTKADRERAAKQAALDYTTMEDSYLNDPKGQWAKEATASSVFGETGSSGASDVNKPQNLVGKPDGRQWTNDHQDMGFDTFEATFEKPVHATEVRVVFSAGIEAVSKLELKGADGTYTTVWSGINEDPEDNRGPRHWFVRKFNVTTQPILAVKLTLANSVERGYKVVDAVQLVGE
jgi:hypothetical protein